MIRLPERLIASREAGLEFEELFTANYARLGAALQLLTGDRTEAEDLAQEVLSRVYERWDRVRDMDSPVGYLYRTALNLSRKRFRRRAHAPIHPPPQQAADPADTAEQRATIREALRALSSDQREALVLVEGLGFSATEAGRILGISADSVRARLYRA